MVANCRWPWHGLLRDGDLNEARQLYPALAMSDLHTACAIIAEAYPDSGVFLVGSSIQRRDFRDVDVRCMLPDELFDAMFPNAPDGPSHWNARWSLLCFRVT